MRVPTIIGKSTSSEQIRAFIRKASKVDFPVLLFGETGVGKEVVARNVHFQSRRREGPFIPVNCAAIPLYLAESELFGHRRGSFTDAKEDRTGLIEAASGGSLFLDEIFETAPEIQAKLLRVLEHGELRRVGETITRNADVRFLFATNRDPERALREGNLREDLYFRINILRQDIPPLRQRRDDIVLFAEHIIEQANIELQQKKKISRRAFEKLIAYSFPGNIRELENIIMRSIALAEEKEIRPDDIDLGKIQKEENEEVFSAKLYDEMLRMGKSYWDVIHTPFLRRDLNRRQVKAVLALGLIQTRGSYRRLVTLFNIGGDIKAYKRFMKVLGRHHLS